MERRRGQRGPEAGYDDLKLWGAVLLKDTRRVRETAGKHISTSPSV